MSEKFDLASLKKIGMIQQKQKEFFAMRLHAVGGDFTSEQLKKVAEVAKKYGRGQLHLSTRQGIEIHFVHQENLEPARSELEAAGIAMGACGPRIRIVVACPGEATCRWGIIETKEIARDLDAKYFRRETPYKFKLSVTGCPHNCAKATENDIGVMGGILPAWNKDLCSNCGLCLNICPTGAISDVDGSYVLDEKKCINCSICTSSCPVDAWQVAQRGFILWLGGTMGKTPRLATRWPGLIDSRQRLDELIERAIEFYQRHGRKKERFGHTIDRIGIEKTMEEILHGK